MRMREGDKAVEGVVNAGFARVFRIARGEKRLQFRKHRFHEEERTRQWDAHYKLFEI